jgi:hypothetical protein
MKNIKQSVLANWYNEAVDYGSPEFKNYSGSKFIIYKGFKITLVDNEYIMEDVRKSDFYNPSSEKDLKVIKEFGFIMGCDLLMNERNEQRVTKYTTTLEKLYSDKHKMIKSKDTKSQKYSNLINSIYKYIDLLQTYKARVSQHSKKYSVPE